MPVHSQTEMNVTTMQYIFVSVTKSELRLELIIVKGPIPLMRDLDCFFD
ncbi:MAG: hypothetical protein ACJ70R_00620 [Nitrososphaera sp.]